MYPYLHWQSLMTYGADVRVRYYWKMFVFAGQLGCGAGKVTEDSWLTDVQAGVQTSSFRLKEYYDWQMEYAAAARVKAGLSLRWNAWKGLYVEARGSMNHAFDLKYIKGNNRIGTTIAIGYNY